jgi:hypothetical protein
VCQGGILEFGFGNVTPPHRQKSFVVAFAEPVRFPYNLQQTTTHYKKTAFKANWQWKHIEERIG